MSKKAFTVVNTVKNISLIIAIITFILAAIAVESAGLDVIVILALIAVVTTTIGAFLERTIVLNYNDKYRPIFTFNQVLSAEVVNHYSK